MKSHIVRSLVIALAAGLILPSIAMAQEEKQEDKKEAKSDAPRVLKIVGGKNMKTRIIDVTGEERVIENEDIPDLNRIEPTAVERIRSDRERLTSEVAERRMAEEELRSEVQAAEAERQAQIARERQAAAIAERETREQQRQMIERNTPQLPPSVQQRTRRSSESIAPRATSPRTSRPVLPEHLINR